MQVNRKQLLPSDVVILVAKIFRCTANNSFVTRNYLQDINPHLFSRVV